MTNSMYGLLFTFLVGLFFLLVLFISKYLKMKKDFLVFLLGLTFSVMIGMVLFGLLPETLECFSNIKNSYLLIFIFTLIGFLLTLCLDKFIPDHHDHDKKMDKDNLMHISVMTSLAIVIHNFVEGASLYTVTLNDSKMGFLMFIAILLHNIPFALTIMMSLKGSIKGRNLVLLSSLVLSTLLGAVFVHLWTLTDFVLGVLISITLGMILYISLIEILNEIIHEKNNKYNYIGIIVGLVAVILLFLV